MGESMCNSPCPHRIYEANHVTDCSQGPSSNSIWLLPSVQKEVSATLMPGTKLVAEHLQYEQGTLCALCKDHEVLWKKETLANQWE